MFVTKQGDCKKDGRKGVAAICTSGSAIAIGLYNFRTGILLFNSY
jgi:hypothetical protein